MKKLFSMLSMLVLIIGLTGCTADLETSITDLEAKIVTLEQEKTALETSVTALETTVQTKTDSMVALETEIMDLEAQITALQGQIFDNVLTFTLTDEFGQFTSKTVGYNDDFEGSAFDLLNANFTVGFSVSDFGTYIYSLENLNPTTGNYISLAKNGEPSMVGIDGVTYEDGDIIEFSILWYDASEKAVFDGVHLFLNNQVANYVNATSIDYNVLAGLALLGKTTDYITKEEATTYVEGLTLTTVADYYKAITILKSVDADASALYTDLSEMVTPGAYGQTAYGLLALSNSDLDYTAFLQSALTDLSTVSPYDSGLDTGGISVVALSLHVEETGVQALVDDYVNWIKMDQLETGGIKTRDSVWGDTTYPGTENAASMSQVILALLANDIDPTGTDFTKTSGDLMSRLCEFQNVDGSFNWLIDAEDADLAFSTPQAFLALAAYYTYSNNGGVAVNPYYFQ